MVKVLFDTSILVASFLKAHPKHTLCANWWQKVRSGEIEGIIASHTLAETYSVLTRIPLRPRISPSVAQQLIQENLKEFEVISLAPPDYEIVIKQMVELNLTGGAIYDALIAQVALKAKVDRLLTLNPKHFTRLGENIANLVQVLD
ncbi:MAG: PIN domain-containing protein [Oscillatoria sp. PMC 1051.18]|nr:PIN domain-containing protein [Oscillatoria sp. PMC 1050.18]MEC5032062.1 PIN domain-containing protein [Oscillatoria sp. PMC 1051.18]